MATKNFWSAEKVDAPPARVEGAVETDKQRRNSLPPHPPAYRMRITPRLLSLGVDHPELSDALAAYSTANATLYRLHANAVEARERMVATGEDRQHIAHFTASISAMVDAADHVRSADARLRLAATQAGYSEDTE